MPLTVTETIIWSVMLSGGVLAALLTCILMLITLYKTFKGSFGPSQDIGSGQSSNPVMQRQPSQKQQAEASTPIVVLYKNEQEGQSNGNDCPICLEEFRAGNCCRFFSNCSHLYHHLCINQWLVTKRNCPLCRASVPRDLEAPLTKDQIVDN